MLYLKEGVGSIPTNFVGDQGGYGGYGGSDYGGDDAYGGNGGGERDEGCEGALESTGTGSTSGGGVERIEGSTEGQGQVQVQGQGEEGLSFEDDF